MSDITFQYKGTFIPSSWLQEINDFKWNLLQGANTVDQVRRALEITSPFVRNITGNYTLTDNDLGAYIVATSGSPITITVPDGLDLVGSTVIIVQAGSGQVSVEGDEVDLLGVSTLARTQHSVIGVTQLDSTTWQISGDLFVTDACSPEVSIGFGAMSVTLELGPGVGQAGFVDGSLGTIFPNNVVVFNSYDLHIISIIHDMDLETIRLEMSPKTNRCDDIISSEDLVTFSLGSGESELSLNGSDADTFSVTSTTVYWVWDISGSEADIPTGSPLNLSFVMEL